MDMAKCVERNRDSNGISIDLHTAKSQNRDRDTKKPKKWVLSSSKQQGSDIRQMIEQGYPPLTSKMEVCKGRLTSSNEGTRLDSSMSTIAPSAAAFLGPTVYASLLRSHPSLANL